MSQPRHSSAPVSPGERLGGFEVRGVLGEGGTGIVYDAVRLHDGRAIALKVIHPHLSGDAQVRGRFIREASILRRLEGPNLSAILDSGEVRDPRHADRLLLYLALPKIEGPSLELLLREGELTLEQGLEIVLGVCQALGAAHAQGIIHRDLKPANVLLEGRKHPVVVDFGLAKIMTGSGTETTVLTSHNMVFGTPEYMSPEQARGDELDARCDVYAVGVILYELVAGTVPFSGTTPLSVLTAHLTSAPPPPSRHPKARPAAPALEAVVLHALAKDPLARYGSASALAAAIQRAREQPNDAEAVKPSRFSPLGAEKHHGPEALAATLPAHVPFRVPELAGLVPESARSKLRDEAGAGLPLWAWLVMLGLAVALGAGLAFLVR